jgi:hypothetical protein
MTMLQKFIEPGPYGEKSGRVAYAFKSNSLPQPQHGMSWQILPAFNAANELLQSPGLEAVFKVAVDKGCALVTRR